MITCEKDLQEESYSNLIIMANEYAISLGVITVGTNIAKIFIEIVKYKKLLIFMEQN